SRAIHSEFDQAVIKKRQARLNGVRHRVAILVVQQRGKTGKSEIGLLALGQGIPRAQVYRGIAKGLAKFRGTEPAHDGICLAESFRKITAGVREAETAAGAIDGGEDRFGNETRIFLTEKVQQMKEAVFLVTA